MDLAPPITSRNTFPTGDEAALSERIASARAQSQSNKSPLWRLALKAFVDGGPSTCHFAITSICNARCGFCNFAVDRLPKHAQHSVTLEEAKLAAEILKRNGINYLIYTGGEPLVHRHFIEMVSHAAGIGMSPKLVTNGYLLTSERIDALASAGLSSASISVDAPSAAAHDKNRGLSGLSERIREANERFRARKIATTASVTMSRLVGDYAALPDFLRSLGFEAVTFSYPLSELASSYLSHADSDLVKYSADELLAAFQAVKDLKREFPVLNPTASLDDMQRHLRGEPEQFGCLAGWKFFYLDWNLDIWRCHNWEHPLCHITEFDQSKRVRDGCTACMIDCYRDDSVMQQGAVAVSDGVRAAARGHFREAFGHWFDQKNIVSFKAVLEEAPIWRSRV